ncbi:hypothetical protein D3C84_282060 [compost metagenome]
MHALPLRLHQPAGDLGGTGFAQQLLDHTLGLGIVAFAEMVIANAPLGVGEIMGRPVMIAEGTPDFIVVVDGHRVVDAQVAQGLVDIAQVFFEGEFGGVHADHHQPLVTVLLGPGLDVRQAAQAVDAGVGPEVHQHHLALQSLGAERRGVEPLYRTVERRQLALDRERGAILPGVQHASGDHHRSVAWRLFAQPLNQRLLQAAGGRGRQAGQNAGVQPQGNGRHAREHRRPQALTQPLPHAQGTFHRREDLATQQQGQGQRGGGAGGIGQQQEGGADVRALQRRTR